MQEFRPIIAAAALIAIAATTIAATPRDGDQTRGGCRGIARARPADITLHLEDRAGLPRAARDEMRRGTTVLWQAAGVDVRWSPDPFPGDHAPAGAHIRVAIAAGAASPSSPAPRPMASIRFVDRTPSTSIDVYPSEVRALLDVFVFDDKPLSHRPRLLQEHLMGRMLGRAVAHEIGHFFFATAAHARVGLMRANHRVGQLIGRSDQPFAVVEPPSATCGQHP